MLADIGEIDEPVYPAQQVIARHVILDAEAVEQRLLHHCPLAHHHIVSTCLRITESGLHAHRKREFFNGIGPDPGRPTSDLPLADISKRIRKF